MNAIKISCLILLITCFARSTAFASRPLEPVGQFTPIDDYIEARMKDLRIPGIALGIVKGDEIVYLKGYGIADPSGRAVTPQTPFHMASLGKSFTALAVMQLVEAGRMELDAPVQRYLPWFRLADVETSSRITIRHLLHQTSGIPGAADWDIIEQNYNGPGAIEQGVRALAAVYLNRPVGESYEYANMNYATLGLIVQTVSGQPYAEYIQQHIFSPLEMSAAYLDASQDRERGAAIGHTYWFGFPRAGSLPRFPVHQPAGADSFTASAEDMSKYLIAQLNGGHYREQNVLSSAGITTLHQPVAATGLPDSFYGMGWETSVINGVPVVHHTGSITGFSSYMALAPQERWGVIVLVNSARAFNVSINTMIISIIELLHERPLTPPPGNPFVVIYTALALVEIIQIGGMIRFVKLTRRWRAQPERRPASRGAMLWHIGLPVVINFIWGIVVLIVLPQLLNLPPRLLATAIPDVSGVLVLSAIVAWVWCFVRTILAFNALRKTDLPMLQTRQQFAEQ